MKQPEYDKVKKRLAALCARSEQSAFDISMKLRRTKLSASERQEILNFLTEYNFIDDNRFAGAFARDKARFSAWGPMKIRYALMEKRLPSGLIDKAVASIPENTFVETAQRLAAAKRAELERKCEDPSAARQKLYRYLLSRGFTPRQISLSL